MKFTFCINKCLFWWNIPLHKRITSIPILQVNEFDLLLLTGVFGRISPIADRLRQYDVMLLMK